MHHGQTLTRRVVTTLLLALTLGARAVSAGSISIQWDPNTEHDVQGYRVFVGTQTGVYTHSVDVGNTTSFIYNNAVDGQRYCFAVAAYTAGPRLGEQSTEVCSDTSGNEPPTLKNPGSQANQVGVALTLQLAGADPESSPVTYAAAGLPTGVTINTNTGFLSGTPTKVGSYSVQATISDGNLSTTQAFSWTIGAALPGVATLLRPTGPAASTTPTFEWESVVTATSYRLWVDDSGTTDPKIQMDYTPAQAGCATAGAICQVKPGIVLAGGRASWSIRASNASGAGPWSGAMDFSVPDTKVPTVAIASPTANTTFTTASGTLTLSGTATDDVAVTKVTWTNNRGGSGTANGTTEWSAGSIPLLGGSNILTVTARDAAGNVTTDVLTVTRSDSGAPTVKIAVPGVGASNTTSQTVMNLTGTASDDVGVTAVTWANDRGGSGTATGTTNWSVSAIALRAGANVITVTAADAAGNRSTDTLLMTVVDQTAPVVTIALPTADPTFSTTLEAVGLRGTASDAFGVTQVAWTNDRGGSGVADGTTQWTVNTLTVKPGANVVTVTARDAAGNTTSDTLTVIVTDKVAPTVSITAPTATETLATGAATFALGGTASDDVAVTQVTWATDKGVSGVAAGTTTWSVPSVPLTAAVTVITVTARDAAGRSSTDVLTVTRSDAVAPTVDITAPSALATLSTTSATIALGGAAADNVGVTQVTWSNNKGGGGTAAGTTAWSAAGVALKPGANVITVTAKDAQGNVATDSLTVTLTDDAAPTVSIARPTTANTHSASGLSVALGGSASDLFGVTEVRWVNNRGGAGVATGTTEWSVPAVALKSGANVITVTARDAAGHTATDSVTVTADGKAPVVAIASPIAAGGFATSEETLTIGGTASDDIGVTELTWANPGVGRGTIAVAASWRISVPLRRGVNPIAITAHDAAGNETTATISVTRDSRAPRIAIAAPAASGTVATNLTSAALSGTANDDAGVTEVTWQNSRGGRGVAAGTSEWSIPSAVLKAGANVITVTARDAGGNATSASLTIVLDRRAPVVSIAAPTAAGTLVSNENDIPLGGTVSDDTAVEEVSWTNSQGGGGVARGTAAWSVNRVALRPGVNTLKVTARDEAGNTATATLIVRVADVRAPRVRIMTPSPEARLSTANGVVTLAGTSSDDFGPVRITWASDRGGSGTANGDGDWSVGGLALQQGVNVITVTAKDAAGNTSADVVRIAFDRGAPTIALTSPTTSTNYGTAATTLALTGVAADDQGVTRVTWSTDKGQTGVAAGTASWSIPAVAVQTGTTTVVTVKAHDNSGNTTSLTLNVTNADATAPVVKVYAPTTAATFATAANAITIGGTATDAVGVTQVSWTNAQGGGGVAFGTSSWGVPGIPLAPGVNVITVTARDAAGNSGVAVLTVTSTQPASSSQLSSAAR